MTSIPFEEFFLQLYSQVIQKEKRKYFVNDNDIIQATRNMIAAYMADDWEGTINPRAVDYNEAASRIAYLHKYAACHTGLVCEMLLRAAQVGALEFIWSDRKMPLRLCFLGGGPGVDIVAFITFLCMIGKEFSKVLMPTVLDYYSNWNNTFRLILSALKSGNYGHMQRVVSKRNFEYKYHGANLLTAFQPGTHQIIASADFLTMVKFVSAVRCETTSEMIQKIFNSMKPGAAMLFIDNAAGGFYELVSEIAHNSNMYNIYGPLKHELYENEVYKVRRFGFESLSQTRVTVQFWRKAFSNQFNYRCENLNNVCYYEYLNREIKIKNRNFVRRFRRRVNVEEADDYDDYEDEEEEDTNCCVIS